MKPGDLFKIFKETFAEWREDKVSRLAAALSYYTIFSLAPLLLIVIAVVGLVMDPGDVKGELYNQISNLLGQEGAEAVQAMVENTDKEGTGTLATIIGVVTLFIGATGVFAQLQDALNTIWEVQPDPEGGFLNTIRKRVLTFTLIPSIGFLLLVSLVVDTLLATARSYFEDVFASQATSYLFQGISWVVALAVITLLFAIIYKVLPDVQIEWRDVWVGAAVTALLFSIGRYLIGLYIGNSSTASTYGAAGSLIVIVLWVYYSAQIVFFGAEFTQVYAKYYGARIRPDEHAIRLTPLDRARQGIPYQSQVENAARRGRPARVREVRVAKDSDTTPKGYAVAALLAFFAGVAAGMRGKGSGNDTTP